jgi:hypothetical protein
VADVGAATGTARSPSRSFAYPLILSLSALDAAGYSVIAPVLPTTERGSGGVPGRRASSISCVHMPQHFCLNFCPTEVT